MNLPNSLTLLRIALAPIFMALFVIENIWTRLAALIIFIIAALTDLYDGYYARKYGISTSFGKFMDPLADKILTSVAFVSFATLGYVQTWMVLAIIVREFLITGLRSLAAYKGVLITPTRMARLKTFLQMMAIAVILVFVNLKTFLPPAGIDLEMFHSPVTMEVFYWLMMVVVIATVGTGVDYVVKNFYLLRNL
ncbi:MAG: CDP-diacylglycerol--glycerol-3-phosphate 3-phosphatidyltransferase [candidate division Zixibacteria bacterium]|nr:CDP-diacylglycerol--glycerol-3-phosphate 3-phosphatidyltransferase [candidate division Zixibacteria bacterium]